MPKRKYILTNFAVFWDPLMTSLTTSRLILTRSVGKGTFLGGGTMPQNLDPCILYAAELSSESLTEKNEFRPFCGCQFWRKITIKFKYMTAIAMMMKMMLGMMRPLVAVVNFCSSFYQEFWTNEGPERWSSRRPIISPKYLLSIFKDHIISVQPTILVRVYNLVLLSHNKNLDIHCLPTLRQFFGPFLSNHNTWV